MKNRKRRYRNRRQSFVLQPGGGFLISSQDQDATVPSTDSNAEQRTLSSNENSSIASNLIDSVELSTLGSQTDKSLSTADDGSILSTILFAPSYLSVTSTETLTTSSSTTSTASSASDSDSLTSSTTSLSSSSESSPSLTSQSMVSLTYSNSASADVASSSASFSPKINAVGRSVGFYAGIVFLSIALLACLVSFVAWLLRSRRKKAIWSTDNEVDDIENQDPGFGLGIYLDQTADGHPEKQGHSILRDTSRTVQLHTDPFIPPLSFQLYTNTPGKYPRQVPLKASPESVQSPIQRLGPLQIKNYVSGDLPSSCDEGASNVLPPPQAVAKGKHYAITKFGTPRRLLDAPRFLGLGGQGLGIPWAPLNIKKGGSTKRHEVGQSPIYKNVPGRLGGAEDRDESSALPPLPMPPFKITSQTSNNEESDSWTSSLRTSIYNAFSGISGGVTKQGEDNFTELPARQHRSCRMGSNFLSKTGELDPKTLIPHSSIFASWASPKVIDVSLPFSQSSSGSATGTFQSSRVDSRLMKKSRTGSYQAAELSLSKEHVNESSRSQTCSDSVNDSSELQAVSRTSSVYSPIPGAFRHSKIPKHVFGSKKRYDIISRTRRRNCDTDTGVGHGLGASASADVRVTHAHTLNQTRPPFLRQETNKSTTSFSSESSETSRDLTDEELRVKQMMMLRARRKRAASRAGRSTNASARSNLKYWNI